MIDVPILLKEGNEKTHEPSKTSLIKESK